MSFGYKQQVPLCAFDFPNSFFELVEQCGLFQPIRMISLSSSFIPGFFDISVLHQIVADHEVDLVHVPAESLKRG